MKYKAILILLLLFILASCSRNKTSNIYSKINNPAFIGESNNVTNDYLIGIGDVIEIQVYGESDLSGKFTVHNDGSISIPLIGSVFVNGLTIPDITNTITNKYKNDYLVTPIITVMMKEINSKKIYIFGEITKPGTVQYEENMTVLQAILTAGGFTKNADKGKIYITRNVKGVEKRISLSVDNITKLDDIKFKMIPGDVIYIPETIF